ncbi:hypothetical protein [Chitinimonas lacunae]|uniref:Uncharacterized protein n=1 Tax=Chitinimonas lacunae TaxID=1963018 RepID=A0ABV8MMJ1_9NEIS
MTTSINLRQVADFGMEVAQQSQNVSNNSGNQQPALQTVQSSANSPIPNKTISLAQAPDNKAGFTELQTECRERLAKREFGTLENIGRKFGAGCLAILSGAVGLCTLIGTAIVTPLALPVAALRDAFSSRWGDLKVAREQAQALRDNLGAPPPQGGVLRQHITFKSPDGPREASVSDLMNVYRARLGSPVSQAEMHTYINMGEKLVKALQSQPDYTGGPIEVDGHMVSPNLDTTRAISWYLQAKALADNASPEVEPAFLNRGSMVMDDPGNKLYNFMNSAPNTYGRASTHFNERSSSPQAGLFNAGLAGMVAGVASGQGAQRGMEDFDNRMPSGKGCLVFDKINSIQQGGTPRLFMKWESVGMPTVLGRGTHADAESGWTDKVLNRAAANFRCLGHANNFFHSLIEHKPKAGEPGIAIDKGPAVPLFNSYKQVLEQAKTDLGHNQAWVEQTLKDSKKHGLAHMERTLQGLQAQYADLQGVLYSHERMEWYSHRGDISSTLRQLNDFKLEMGVDLGLDTPDWGVHREAVNKGQPKPLFEEYKTMLSDVGTHLNKPDNWAEVVAHDTKHFGLAHMTDVLHNLRTQYEGPKPNDVRNTIWQEQGLKVNDLLDRVDTFTEQQGIGSNERRGVEVHVRQPWAGDQY